MEQLKPFYMWAGGKSRLLKHYEDKFPSLSHYSNYVEPFFGGGAVFCNLYNQYAEANPELGFIINDVNSELAGILRALKTDTACFIEAVDALTDEYLAIEGKERRKSFYYEKRREYWKTQDSALLYFLMRTGFNGIWQTNKEGGGLFATPAGLLNHKAKEQVFQEPLLLAWADALQRTEINSTDYKQVLVPDGSFVYCDPPYRGSFTSYGTDFDDEHQKQLCEWMEMLVHDKNCAVAMSNRTVDDDNFFEEILSTNWRFHYFDVTYTAGRRLRTQTGFQAKPARELLVISAR
ncbi:MAG: Dam family site-specific DNA-(adenine-N6)-methyltransferase [Actinomyces sp.]|uniref:DNA adenine methylase n=1 Tax=Actinomyces sp. TaxID=29317 RepID=UPI001EB4D70C|nr:Dam family site-specific DNA-(adenine-N6)-methyltransferase [Actinomyces sp.]MBS5826393.1 Dam family site-specific DNA-(adenine-N6)-methyltransferase [Actinomyces sp.]